MAYGTYLYIKYVESTALHDNIHCKRRLEKTDKIFLMMKTLA